MFMYPKSISLVQEFLILGDNADTVPLDMLPFSGDVWQR